MTKYLMVFLAIFLVGCTPQTPQEAAMSRVTKSLMVSGSAIEICLQGVSYYFMPYDRGLVVTPVFRPDSTVKPCKIMSTIE